MSKRTELDAKARDAVARIDAVAYSIRDALARVPVKRTTLEKAIKSGALKSHLVGRRRVILRSELVEWLTGGAQSNAAADAPAE